MTTANPSQPEPIPFVLDNMPEDIRTEPGLAKFKTVGDLAKSYLNAEKMIGADANHVFKIPKDGNLTEVWKKLGKPEKYEVPNDLKIPLSDDYKGKLSAKADTLNMTEQQFKELVYFTDSYGADIVAKAQADATAEQEQQSKAIKDFLGASYDQTMNYAKDVPETFGKPKLWEKIEKSGLSRDPEFIGMMADIGRLADDGKMLTGKSTGNFAMSPAQAGAEIRSLRANADFVKQWTDKSNPGHRDALERMNALYKIANPG